MAMSTKVGGPYDYEIARSIEIGENTWERVQFVWQNGDFPHVQASYSHLAMVLHWSIGLLTSHCFGITSSSLVPGARVRAKVARGAEAAGAAGIPPLGIKGIVEMIGKRQ